MAVSAAVVRAGWKLLLMSLLMAAGAKAMKCLLRVSHLGSGVFRWFALGLSDGCNAEIFGLMAVVTALNRLISVFAGVVAGDTVDTF